MTCGTWGKRDSFRVSPKNGRERECVTRKSELAIERYADPRIEHEDASISGTLFVIFCYAST